MHLKNDTCQFGLDKIYSRASVFSGSRDMHAQLDFEHWEIFIP